MLVDVSSADIHRLSDIIRAETGNQVVEKNHSMIVSRIRTRLLKLQLESMDQYWEYFSQNEVEEREVLRSLMTTHYTFFFREYVHFEVLQSWIQANGQRLKDRFAKTQQPVRVWSAASSRGQEVYSIATFLELELKTRYGVPFEVIGTDIDQESVGYAKNGVYPIKEVNTIPQIYLARFWKRGTGAVKDFAAVHPAVKTQCKFDVLNLLEIDRWANKETFDVIFCRNVFIYFSEQHVQQIVKSLTGRLDRGGLFVTGLSEPIRFDGFSLQSIGPSCYSFPQASSGVQQKNQPETAPRPPSGNVIPLHSKSGREDKPASAQTQVALQTYRVLCVDDSTTIQALMKKIFSSDPLCSAVEIAKNGREAREKLDKGKYDVITLDIHMPEVSGIEFLEKHYDRKEDPPVVMISSVNRTDVELATKSLQLGAFDYVEKPAMNNLQKSTQEILTKVKMAIRARASNERQVEAAFDATIGQKIVVPDASQCFRIVVAGSGSLAQLEQIVKSQANEYRSPALIVLWSDGDVDARIEAPILGWTGRTVTTVRTSSAALRPNYIFLTELKNAEEVLSKSRAKSISLQVLTNASGALPNQKLWGRYPQVQLLVDESIESNRDSIERQVGCKVSDISPATSFSSLSLEFFANLRKAAA